MSSNKATFILMVLDESGSMASKRQDVIGGFNAFISEQRQEPSPCRVSLIKFNTRPTQVFDAKPLAEVPALTEHGYIPGGNTALFDAIAEAVRLADQHRKPEERVLCVIMTDGEENSSRETTGEQVKQIITAREAQGDWTFVYIGAAPDAWVAEMGLSAQNVAAYDPNAPAGSFQQLSSSTLRFRRKAARKSQEFLKPNGNGDQKP
jgi:Mg-chelatase subunit ChlD